MQIKGKVAQRKTPLIMSERLGKSNFSLDGYVDAV